MNWKSKDDYRKYYRGYMANYRQKVRDKVSAKVNSHYKYMRDEFILKAF